MKKFQSLGRSLSKNEMKNVFGGVAAPDNGCTATLSGCNGGNTITCDYHITCTSGVDRFLCEAQCINSDASTCAGLLPA